MKNINELRQKLKIACSNYYNGTAIMTDHEYDKLLSELETMERAAGYVDESVTNTVGADPEIKGLAKVKHEYPALSLGKTKDVDEIVGTFKNKSVLMWKLDGLTVQLTYENGKLKLAATRGNGEVGQDITEKARLIEGIPSEIPEKSKIVVRGEVLMEYAEFERVNAAAGNAYENPRNLASGTLASDLSMMLDRKLNFKAFNLVYYMNEKTGTAINTFQNRFLFLQKAGFDVVDHVLCESSADLEKQIANMTGLAEKYEFPVDGLVVADNDAIGTDDLVGTGSHPNIRKGYALKWQDETVETVLRDIEWSNSRTGLLNPVAVFDAIRLEGTTVTRASLHNVNCIEELNLQIGDRITVFKANKIIPQVDQNLYRNEHPAIEVHTIKCPVCGCITDINMTNHNNHIVKTMWCKNPNCAAKKIGKFVHFCERDCMNILGMSDAIITKMVNAGILKEFADFYKFADSEELQEEMSSWEGFGKTAVANYVTAIKKSASHVQFIPLIHALGIANIGKGQAKLMKPIFEKKFASNINLFFRDMGTYDWSTVDGLGPVRNQSLQEWSAKYAEPFETNPLPDQEDTNKPDGYYEMFHLMRYLSFENVSPEKEKTNGKLTGMTFVVTGAMSEFDNREDVHCFIEKNGGKTAGSVSSKTTYLVNNDIDSDSGKNKKAKDLGIPIISEKTLISMAAN